MKIGNQLSSSTEVEKNYKIDLTKLKEKNNRYFLTIIVKYKTGMSSWNISNMFEMWP